MQVLGSRRGALITFGVAGAAVIAAGGFAATQVMGRPAVDPVTPGPGTAVATDTPTISFDTGAEELTSLTVLIDGVDQTGRARSMDGKVVLVPPPLKDGPHTVDVSVESPNLIQGSAQESWDFTVDTVAPSLTVAKPEDGVWVSRKTVAVTGRSEPGATVTVAWKGGTAEGVVGDDGRYSVRPELEDGQETLTITSVDAAGNSTMARRRVLVDSVAPELGLNAPGDGAEITDDPAVEIRGAVPNEDLTNLTVGAKVNGVKTAEMTGADADAIAGAIAEGTYFGDDPVLAVEGRRFTLTPGSLPQGRNTVVVWVADQAGNEARAKRVVMVDTTEEFGDSEMVRGATGEDVATLQQRLKDAGVLKGKITRKYDQRVEKAVERYQRKHDLKVSGRVDQAMLDAMVGRIVVDLSEFSLKLIRDGGVVKSFQIATGSPAHPTPTGTYEVIDMQVDPAWFPPDSPWAEGLGPIPPGPGNPLGTRWIGTSAPAIGIHGTYADDSIGTAASHGCMRMHIPDVEELYEEVSLGMEVQINP